MNFENELLLKLEHVKKRFYKLVILVGYSGSGKTKLLKEVSKKMKFPYINMNQYLSKELKEIPYTDRSLSTIRLLQKIVKSFDEDTLLLDNTELIFTKELEVDPISIFQRISRSKTIIISWNGSFNGKSLRFGQPNQNDYKIYKLGEIESEVLSIN